LIHPVVFDDPQCLAGLTFLITKVEYPVAPIHDLPTPINTPYLARIGIEADAVLIHLHRWRGRRRWSVTSTDPARAAEAACLVGGYQYVVTLPDLKTKLTSAVGTPFGDIRPISPDHITLNTRIIDI
jgi:hypothetical protein